MPLCDYFIASTADIEKLKKAGKVPASLTRIDAKGFDDVPLDALAKLLETRRAVEQGEPILPDDGAEWVVQKLTDAMRDALANVSDADVKKHGKTVAAIEELGWPAKEGQRIVGELRTLARTAREKKLGIYMWLLP